MTEPLFRPREYAAYRPRSPKALFGFIAAHAPRRRLVWDVGCGSGQASVDLAGVFERVHATDADPGQVAQAPPHPRVRYEVRPASDSGLPDASADAVVAAQAVHWFDEPAFYAECRRAAAPGAFAAFWSYAFHASGDPALDAVMDELGRGVLGPYWKPELAAVRDRYRTLRFPFAREVEAPAFTHEVDWTLPELLGYWSSWSAWKAYEQANGESPLAGREERLRCAWGSPESRRALRAPLGLRAGYLS